MLITHLLLAALTYISPVKYEVSLAGNFGEPRPNHFHGGVDVKTQRVEGKPIHAVAEGYVCRVTVSQTGYGNAVYVRHPDGHTTVYAHLQRFSPAIEAKVKKWQYAHHKWEADVTFRATDVPVSKGQVIALSGNTGSSMGPHLHLEVHETDSWDMYDPLEFIPSLVNDHKAPETHAFMAYPMPGKGVFCGKTAKMKFKPTELDSLRLEAWGEVGFGIHADDYMEDSPNYYGVRRTVLYVDDKEVFRSDVNGIPFQTNRMVNSWGDYDEFSKNKHWFMKSFIEPGNQLPVLHADGRRGVVLFDHERDYHIRYELSDYYGNISTCRFVVRGRRMEIPQRKLEQGDVILDHNAEKYETEGFKMILPSGALADDVVLHPVDSAGIYSRSYHMASKSLPLIVPAQISIRLGKEVSDVNKLFIASDGKFTGGKFNEGWVEAPVYDIGKKLTVGYDDIPPVIERVNDDRPTVIILEVKDADTGIESIEAAVDGQFVLFAPIGRSSRYICNLKNTPVKPTSSVRTLQFMACDKRGNQCAYQTKIKY